MNEGRRVVITVVFNNCRNVEVGADVVGIVFERRQRRLNFLGVSNDDRFVNVDHGGEYWRSRKNARCWWREQCNFNK